jgi:hypothetical protein
LKLFQQCADPAACIAQPLAISVSDNFQRNFVLLGESRKHGAQGSEKARPTTRPASLVRRAIRPAAVCTLPFLLLDSADDHGVARQPFLQTDQSVIHAYNRSLVSGVIEQTIYQTPFVSQFPLAQFGFNALLKFGDGQVFNVLLNHNGAGRDGFGQIGVNYFNYFGRAKEENGVQMFTFGPGAYVCRLRGVEAFVLRFHAALESIAVRAAEHFDPGLRRGLGSFLFHSEVSIFGASRSSSVNSAIQ